MNLTPSKIRAIAPHVVDHLFLWRPTRAHPPLATLHELKTVYHLDDLFDMNEMLDLEEHITAKAMEKAGRPR